MLSESYRTLLRNKTRSVIGADARPAARRREEGRSEGGTRDGYAVEERHAQPRPGPPDAMRSVRELGGGTVRGRWGKGRCPWSANDLEERVCVCVCVCLG